MTAGKRLSIEGSVGAIGRMCVCICVCVTFILGPPKGKQAVINIQMKSEIEVRVSWVLLENYIFIPE